MDSYFAFDKHSFSRRQNVLSSLRQMQIISCSSSQTECNFITKWMESMASFLQEWRIGNPSAAVGPRRLYVVANLGINSAVNVARGRNSLYEANSSRNKGINTLIDVKIKKIPIWQLVNGMKRDASSIKGLICPCLALKCCQFSLKCSSWMALLPRNYLVSGDNNLPLSRKRKDSHV